MKERGGSGRPGIARTGWRFSPIIFCFVLGICAAAADNVEFEQKVQLSFTPGLPGEILVTHPNLHIEKVRALISIDDKLIVIPLRSRGSGNFVGVFPSPRVALEYRLQFIDDNGEAALTEPFLVRQSCGPVVAAAGSLVPEAIELDQDIERLRYAGKFLAGLEGR